MTEHEIIDTLIAAGFVTGWALLGTELTLWEHEVDPPAPLVRPEEQSE